MLIQQPQVRIVTRPVTLDNGEAALAYFALVNIAGQIEVRFLGTKAVAAPVPEAALLLENHVEQIFGETPSHSFGLQPSPFLSSFCLLLNQLARAPSMN